MNTKNHKINIHTPDPGYEPFPVSIINRSTYEAMTFDPSLGKPATISYGLNKGGCIRIRLTCRGQESLVIRTLQDWTNQDFGKYELKWDGRDASGNIVDNKRLFVLFEAKDQGRGLNHQGHKEGSCRDPLLRVEVTPQTRGKSKGTIEVRTTLVGETQTSEDKTGYEVRYFIDYELFKTETFDKKKKEFSLKVDTISLKNGDHLITVNVDDFNDHIGSGGVKIKVEN